ALAARGTTQGQALFQPRDGVRQVPLGEAQLAEDAVGNDQCGASACQRGAAERLLRMAPTLGEGSELAQGPRQPHLGLDQPVYPGRASLPVCGLDVAPQQRGRPAEIAEVEVDLPEAMGGRR